MNVNVADLHVGTLMCSLSSLSSLSTFLASLTPSCASTRKYPILDHGSLPTDCTACCLLAPARCTTPNVQYSIQYSRPDCHQFRTLDLMLFRRLKDGLHALGNSQNKRGSERPSVADRSVVWRCQMMVRPRSATPPALPGGRDGLASRDQACR